MLNRKIIVGIVVAIVMFFGIYSFAQSTNDDGNLQGLPGDEPTDETVNGEDEVPVIILNGEIEETIEVGTTYEDDGATAMDEEDGDITDDIIIDNQVDEDVVGTYIVTVTYNVTDSAENVADEVVRTVYVVDITKPEITLIGDTEITIEVGSTYTDAGATATD